MRPFRKRLRSCRGIFSGAIFFGLLNGCGYLGIEPEGTTQSSVKHPDDEEKNKNEESGSGGRSSEIVEGSGGKMSLPEPTAAGGNDDSSPSGGSRSSGGSFDEWRSYGGSRPWYAENSAGASNLCADNCGCDPGENCNIFCSENDSFCRPICRQGARCEIETGDAEQIIVDCNEGAVCIASDSHGETVSFVCKGGGQCKGNCGGAENCQLTCQGEGTSCILDCAQADNCTMSCEDQSNCRLLGGDALQCKTEVLPCSDGTHCGNNCSGQ